MTRTKLSPKLTIVDTESPAIKRVLIGDKPLCTASYDFQENEWKPWSPAPSDLRATEYTVEDYEAKLAEMLAALPPPDLPNIESPEASRKFVAEPTNEVGYVYVSIYDPEPALVGSRLGLAVYEDGKWVILSATEEQLQAGGYADIDEMKEDLADFLATLPPSNLSNEAKRMEPDAMLLARYQHAVEFIAEATGMNVKRLLDLGDQYYSVKQEGIRVREDFHKDVIRRLG